MNKEPGKFADKHIMAEDLGGILGIGKTSVG